MKVQTFLGFLLASAAVCFSGCSLTKTYLAVQYGIGVSSDRWKGVYEVPIEGHVGDVWADFHKFAESLESTFVFRNKTLGFEGSGTFNGYVRGGQVSMVGQVKDNVQGDTSISMDGTVRDGVMEGTFIQRTGQVDFRGRFMLVRVSHTSYLAGVPRHQVTSAGQSLIELGVASPGLLGPGNVDRYGPGIHSDATGRPFAWRTDDGQMVSGQVKPDAYGLGVGMDQFGRPVLAKPLW